MHLGDKPNTDKYKEPVTLLRSKLACVEYFTFVKYAKC